MQTTDGADRESTAASETRIVRGAASEERVNSPERRKLKKARHEAAYCPCGPCREEVPHDRGGNWEASAFVRGLRAL